MLRKRSIAPGSNKQGGFMQDQSFQSPSPRANRPTSSFFPSPRLLAGLSSKGFVDPETAMSPTSILENKSFASIGNNPFFAENKKPLCGHRHHSHVWESGDSGAIGLGLVDALKDENSLADPSKKESRMVLFGSQLKIQIPPIIQRPVSPSGSVESPRSPVEFGIKTMNSHAGLLSPSFLGNEGAASPCVFTGMLSASEMELSEDYTRVIMHGPNPKTTHIFDNCKVESCGDSPVCPSDVFLRFCYACGENLGQSRDIFMHGGEKAFCSRECRCKDISGEKRIEKQPEDDL